MATFTGPRPGSAEHEAMEAEMARIRERREALGGIPYPATTYGDQPLSAVWVTPKDVLGARATKLRDQPERVEDAERVRQWLADVDAGTVTAAVFDANISGRMLHRALCVFGPDDPGWAAVLRQVDRRLGRERRAA